jgi:hypothetical protein
MIRKACPALDAGRVRRISDLSKYARASVAAVRERAGWSLVACDGKPIGYVATRDLSYPVALGVGCLSTNPISIG